MDKYIPYTEDLESGIENAYEAVIVIARRARKIAADQKLEIEKNLSTVAETTEGEEPVVREKAPMKEFEKPIMISFKELGNKELSFDYKEK